MRNQRRELIPDPELHRVLDSVLYGDILTLTMTDVERSSTTAISGPSVANHGIVGIDMYAGVPFLIRDFAGTVIASISTIEIIGREKWTR